MGISEYVKDNFDKKDLYLKDYYLEMLVYFKLDLMMLDDVKKIYVKFSFFNYVDNVKCL